GIPPASGPKPRGEGSRKAQGSNVSYRVRLQWPFALSALQHFKPFEGHRFRIIARSPGGSVGRSDWRGLLDFSPVLRSKPLNDFSLLLAGNTARPLVCLERWPLPLVGGPH